MGVEDLKKMDEHMEKPPVKKTLLQKLADNRAKQRATKEHYKKIYMEEYNKSRTAAIKKRAKQEAYEKHRPTRKQKIDSILKGFGNLGLGAAGVPQRSKSQPRKKRSQSHKAKKKRNSFDLDLGFVDDIGDFDF